VQVVTQLLGGGSSVMFDEHASSSHTLVFLVRAMLGLGMAKWGCSPSLYIYTPYLYL
jgi:hypothetical protein